MSDLSRFSGGTSAFHGVNYHEYLRIIVDRNKDINAPVVKGMSLLHIAIARNDELLVRKLIGLGARFFPDEQGRMPSLVATLTGASERICDMVNEAEQKATGV